MKMIWKSGVKIQAMMLNGSLPLGTAGHRLCGAAVGTGAVGLGSPEGVGVGSGIGQGADADAAGEADAGAGGVDPRASAARRA